MQLKTLSASALLAFEECPARYHAENVLRTPRVGGTGPADLGTAVHGALEQYVVAVYLDQVAQPSFTLLSMYYEISYAGTFGTSDRSDPSYREGLKMLQTWFDRTDLSGVQILSCEKKYSIPIKTSIGMIPLNFIWDRCEMFYQGGKKIIRVVDYKTIRANISPDELRVKLQARIYAMCAAIFFKEEEPDEIWIQFDLLRYGPVEVTFDRDKNLETWKYVKSTAEKIIATDGPKAPRSLGSGCQWCVLKTTCPLLQRNIDGGGIMSMSLEQMMENYLALESQAKAAKYAMEDLVDRLLAEARHRNEVEIEEGDYRLEFRSRKSRTVDSRQAVEILGPELSAQLASFGVTEIESMLKSPQLNDAQKSLLRRTIGEKWGDPRPKITKLSLGK